MSKFEERMENIFNVAPQEIEYDKGTDVIVSNPVSALDRLDLDSDLKSDYEDSRQNFEELTKKGLNAIDDMLAIARESEHPRAYEVLATLIKNVGEINDKSIDLQKKIRNLTGKVSEKSSETKIDKAIFVGSTADLAKMIKDMKNNG